MGQFILNGRNYSGITYANGCFIDTDNIITSGTYSSEFEYTATQDCVFRFVVGGTSSSAGKVYLNGQIVQSTYAPNNNDFQDYFFLKKGQTIKLVSPQSGTWNYTVYGIQEGSPVTFLSEYASACYDTTEREVGCWVDGKPLYKRTWDLGSDVLINSNTWTNTSIMVADVNFEKIIGSQGTNSGGTNFGFIGANRDQTYVQILQTRNSAISIRYLTLLYTKTTDVAGSGKLTPTAMPTVHYSTSEQVVGTFLGKPLYQRTWDIESGILISYNGWTDTSIDSTNIENIVSVKATHPDGTCYEGIMADPTRQNHTLVGLQTTRNGNDARARYVTIQYTKTT